jgi:Flp pilus assembly protein TadB
MRRPIFVAGSGFFAGFMLVCCALISAIAGLAIFYSPILFWILIVSALACGIPFVIEERRKAMREEAAERQADSRKNSENSN